MLADHPTALLLAEVGVVLLASRATGRVFRAIGQPLVVAEIVAGIALGPSFFGWIAPDAMAALFPPDRLQPLLGLSQLGLVLFMFLIGLELDWARMQGLGRVAMAVSLSGIVLPFVLGVVFALGVMPRFAPPGVSALPFALFFGASMAVTAFPVLARILTERGLLETRVGTLALTAAAVNDVAAWCLLAFVIAVYHASGLNEALWTTGAALVFIAVMLWLLRPLLARVEQRYATMQHLSPTGFAWVLLSLFASGIVSELIGIHALFGAFMFGAALPRHRGTLRGLTDRMEDVVVVLLLPLFFASTGLRTRLDLLADRDAWLWCGAITVLATVGKVAGAAIPGRIGGLGWRESATLGVLMNTRGLMELIILSIGLELGVLTPELFAMLVVMAVATTFITTPLVRLLVPAQRVIETRVDAPTGTPEWTLLACVAHPDSAPDMARMAAHLCAAPGSRCVSLRLLALSDQPSLFPHEDGRTDEVDAADVLARDASRAGVPVESLRFASDDPAADIVAVATRRRASAILVGIHRPLVGTARLGGPLAAIAARADVPLCMFHAAPNRRVRRVLVALGGASDRGVEQIAARLRAAPGLDVRSVDLRDAPDRVQRLIAEAGDVDLVVVAAGVEWDLPMRGFEIRPTPLLTDLRCSLLVVHAPPPA